MDLMIFQDGRPRKVKSLRPRRAEDETKAGSGRVGQVGQLRKIDSPATTREMET